MYGEILAETLLGIFERPGIIVFCTGIKTLCNSAYKDNERSSLAEFLYLKVSSIQLNKWLIKYAFWLLANKLQKMFPWFSYILYFLFLWLKNLFFLFMTFHFSLFIHDLQCHGGGMVWLVCILSVVRYGGRSNKKEDKKTTHTFFLPHTFQQNPLTPFIQVHKITAAKDCHHNNDIWSDYTFQKIAAMYFSYAFTCRSKSKK